MPLINSKLTAISTSALYLFILSLFTLTILTACSQKDVTAKSEVLAKFHPRTWYAGRIHSEALVSGNGQFVAYLKEYNLFVKDKNEASAWNLTDSLNYTWCWGLSWVNNREDLQYSRLILGENALKERMKTTWDAPIDPLSGIQNRNTDYSPDGNWVVYNGSKGIWALHQPDSTYKLVVPDMHCNGLVVSPTELKFAYVSRNDSGLIDVFVADIVDSSVIQMASNLDGPPQRQALAYSTDGNSLYLSLVSTADANLNDRHKPIAPKRDIKVFRLDLATKYLELVVDDIGDNFVAGVNDSSVFWMNMQTYMRIGVAPASGGDLKIVTDELTSLAYWSPDGSELSAMFGDWRNADWAMNWDLGVYSFDKSALTTSNFRPEISGYHEDYGLLWSPNGKWFAYHSHRSPDAVATYGSSGSTDDIYLRAVAGGEEIQLNSFGREDTAPDWAPNSRQLVFCTVGESHQYHPWIITIDTLTGQPQSVDSMKVAEGIGPASAAAWSPDGKQIALDVISSELGDHQLWLMDIDGSNSRKICEFKSIPELGGVDFSPDGTQLFYSGLDNEHHKIFSVDIASLKSELIAEKDGHELIWPQVSPDGKLVSATVYKHTLEVRRKALSQVVSTEAN